MPVRPYEIVYIIDPDVNETDSVALVERFRALAEAQEATDIRVDTHTIGKRRLAYVIAHKREGQYVIMHFMGEAKVPAELDRVLHITDGILRSMVVRLEVMPPAPTPPPPPPPAPAAVVPEPEPEVVAAPETEPEAAEEPVEAAAAEEAIVEEPVVDEPVADTVAEPTAETVADDAPVEESAKTEE